MGVVAVVAALLIAVTWASEIWIPTLPARSPAVKSALQKVLFAQFLSGLSGNYWENEMLDQGRAIQHLTLQERQDFYLHVILNCKLDTSVATAFVEMVGNDGAHLKNYLTLYRQTPEFRKLSSSQQTSVVDWISELGVIAELPK